MHQKINQTFNSYYYRMNYKEIEIEWMKEILRDKEEEIKKLNERIRFLEQCLDNKEKVNKSLREELEIWKLTAKDYAKQCWVDLDDDLKI